MVNTKRIAGFLGFASHLLVAALSDAVAAADTCEDESSLLQSRAKFVLGAEAHQTADVQCFFLEEDILYEDGREEAIWACEMESGKALTIAGLRDGWVAEHEHQLISGRTKLRITQAVLSSTTLTIPDGTDPTIVEVIPAIALVGETTDPVNPNTPFEENRTFLVLRVIANDAEVTDTAAKLGDEVFGTLGDKINLKERFESCSYGKFNVKPFIGTTTTGRFVANGVVDIKINMNVIGASNSAVRNAVNSAATQFLGDLSSQFRHVMQVLPAGTGSWVAYAYINHWLSVYNNRWGSKPSAQVHEIGHNLRLGHSGESSTYDDKSGLMGYSYNSDEGPVMCYNGAKNWQFAWYSGAYALADPRQTEWSGKLIGIASYQEAGNDMYVVLKLETGTATDYYVSFNSKHGINAGTQEGGNQVLVHTTGGNGDRVYTTSKLKAKLGQGQKFAISNFGGAGDTVTVTVARIDTGASPPVAFVTVSNPSLSTTMPMTTTTTMPTTTTATSTMLTTSTKDCTPPTTTTTTKACALPST